MSCCGEREKIGEVKNEQKWDYINLSDFRSSSCITPLSYGILYILLLISVAVYAVDLFTCANLLLFDRWSGQVKPAIPFHISRWIFTACILLSWVLLAYRWWRAVRAIRTGVVAASYLDPLGVRLQSIRMGPNGRGWRRFLVFAALTKGRKGAEYVALFTYFSFEAWLRICFAEGPRQVINALTLYSVMQADLVPNGQHAAKDGHTPVAQFFVNLQILANKDREQAAILFGMLFTLIIWIFSALSLMLAVLMYIFFLWHHVRDGSLSQYCRRKIDTRLHRIVMVKVNRALEKDSNFRSRQDMKGFGTNNTQKSKRQPTLPTLPALESETTQDVLPISRQTTHTENSPSGSRPSSSESKNTLENHLYREPTVPNVTSTSRRPTLPSRTTTQSSFQSNASFASDTPLINSDGEMDHRPLRPQRVIHTQRPPPGRSLSGFSPESHPSYNPSPAQMRPPARQNTDTSGDTRSIFKPLQPTDRKPMPKLSQRPTQEYEIHPQSPVDQVNRPPSAGGYVAYNPNIHNTAIKTVGSAYPNSSCGPTPTRNFTLPHRPTQPDYFGPKTLPPQRSGTAPLPQAAVLDGARYDTQNPSTQRAAVRPPVRSTTAGPGSWNWQNRPFLPHD